MKKRIISLFLITAIVISVFLAGGISASASSLNDHITITGFDPDMDYMEAMQRTLDDGGPYALQIGAIYEQQRNLKIDSLKLDQKKTAYFSSYTTAQQIRSAMEADTKPKYSEEDLDLLSRVIYAEVGCSWIPDWVQRMTGSVVLNRVNSKYYPDTIREVIYQPGQYSPTWDGSIDKKPDERTVKNAKYLLEHGSICPANVVGQNSVVTGSGVYRSYYDSVLGTTVYFCYQ